MAKRLFTTAGLTFNAVAAGSAITAAVNYLAVKGGAGTQLIDIFECKVSGMAVASTVAAFVLKRASTIETTPTTLAAPNSDGGMFPNISALSNVVVTFIAAGTNPTPSNTVTDATLDLGLNAFGGIFRWNAAPGQEWKQVGNTAPGGESVLFNSSTAGGSNAAANIHIIYEAY
jgi:hypothetical protein